MDLSERVKSLAENVERVKKVMDSAKRNIGKAKSIDEVKAVMAKNAELERKLDMIKENMEGKSRALVELEEEVESLLREVHKPPSLVNLAGGRVVEEGLGVGEIPTTLRVRVEGLMEERRERARKTLDNFTATWSHYLTVNAEALEATVLANALINQLIDLAS